jgi:calcineurin-like phosphoesterase family protein
LLWLNTQIKEKMKTVLNKANIRGNVWISSDTHYYHANIIKYCKRPYIKDGDLNEKGEWKDKAISELRAEEMTQDMVRWHNELVKPEDTVIHLGDFSFGNADQVAKLLKILKGNYWFIWGNHDRGLKELVTHKHSFHDLLHRIKFLGDLANVTIEGQHVTLCHYAMRTWRNSHRGSWHLFGHSHGTLPDDPNSLSFDVGVDCHNLRPISWYQIKNIMVNKKFICSVE